MKKNKSKEGSVKEFSFETKVAIMESMLDFVKLSGRLVLYYSFWSNAKLAGLLNENQVKTEVKVPVPADLAKIIGIKEVSIFDLVTLTMQKVIMPNKAHLIFGYNLLQDSDENYITDINFDNEEEVVSLINTFTKYMDMDYDCYSSRILAKYNVRHIKAYS